MSAAAASRQTGTCKWFSAAKGYGFITSSHDQDLFVHHSAIQGDGFKTLGEGEAVEFEAVKDDSGRWKAVNVTGPEGASVVGDQRSRPPMGNRPFRNGANGGRGGGGYSSNYQQTRNYAPGRYDNNNNNGYDGGHHQSYGTTYTDNNYCGQSAGGYIAGGTYQQNARY